MRPSERMRRRRMEILRWCLLVTFLVMFLDVSASCPNPCTCYVPAEVHCTFRSLALVPSGVHRSVRRINLGFNSISRIDKESLAELRKLELLMMHGNNIHQIPDGLFRDLMSLQVLKMSYNKVKVITDYTLSGLTHLVRLHLDNNHIEFIHPDAFRGMTSLRLLHLEGNRLQKLHPLTFSTFSLLNHFPVSTIKHLYLADNYLTSLPRETLRNMPHLENLFLYGNPWTCDCRLDWLQDWTARNSGVMKCKRDKAHTDVQVCPMCSSPRPLSGKPISGPGVEFQCTGPVINNSPGKDISHKEHLTELLTLEDFKSPLGNITLNLSDEHGTTADLTCQVIQPRESAEIRWNYTDGLQIAANVTASVDLECPVDREKYSSLWRLLAYYSEVVLHLRREIMLSKEPELSYRYKQDIERDAHYYTGVRANILSRPSWLMQSFVNLQLNRPYSTFNTVKLIFTTRVSSTTDSEQSRRHKRPWVMIKHDNSTQTTFTSVVGGLIQMDCKVVSSGGASVHWMLPDGSKVRTTSGSLNNRVSVSSVGKLIIKSVDHSDSGVYYCIAEVLGDVDVLPFRLSVAESSSPLAGDGTVVTSFEKLSGEPAYFPCNSTASPDAEVSWIFPDGSIITANANSSRAFIFSNGTLLIPQCRPDDNGDYKCVALNQHGDDTVSAKLTVTRRQGTQPLRRYPTRPLSAAGVSMKVRAFLDDTEESSGDETDQRRILPNKESTNQNRKPQWRSRVYPGHRKPIRKVLTGQQRKDVLLNRRRIDKSKSKIDPQTWADLLAKIREKTVSNTVTPSVNPGVTVQRVQTVDAGSHTNIEGSSPDDVNLLKEESSIVVSQNHIVTVTTPSLLHQITSPESSVRSDEVRLRPATPTPAADYLLERNHLNATSAPYPEEKQLENSFEEKLGISSVSTDLQQMIIKTTAQTTKDLTANVIKQRAPSRPYNRTPWNSRRWFGSRGRINRLRPRPSLPLITNRSQTVTPTESTGTHKPSTTATTSATAGTSAHSTSVSITSSQKQKSSKDDDRNDHHQTNVLLLADKIIPHDPQLGAGDFNRVRTTPTFYVPPAGMPTPRPANEDTTTESRQNMQTLSTEPWINYRVASTAQAEGDDESHAATRGKFMTFITSQRSVTEDDTSPDSSTLTSTPVTAALKPPPPAVTLPHQGTSKDSFPDSSMKLNQTVFKSTAVQSDLLEKSHSVFPIRIPGAEVGDAELLSPDACETPGSISTTPVSTTSRPTSKSNHQISAKILTTTRTPSITTTGILTTNSHQTTSLNRRLPTADNRIPYPSKKPQTNHIPDLNPRRTFHYNFRNPLIIQRTPAVDSSVDVRVAGSVASSAAPVTFTTLVQTTITAPTPSARSVSRMQTGVHSPNQNIGRNPRPPYVPAPRAKPRITSANLTTVTVNAETDVQFPCNSVGEPKPFLTWTKISTGALISENTRIQRFEVKPNGTLVIRNVQLQDRGQYVCTARTPYGTDRMVVSLIVLTQTPKILLPLQHDTMVYLGDRVNLECEAQALPHPKIIWVLPNQTLVQAVSTTEQRLMLFRNGTLHIKQTRYLDSGIYKCIASNMAGAAAMSIRLHVTALPPIIQQRHQENHSVSEGQTLYLHCSAKGAPHPVIRWITSTGMHLRPSQYINGNLFVFPNGTLYIRTPTERDSGTYQCAAINSVGVAKRNVNVSVKRISSTAKITFTSPLRSDVTYGSYLKLDCSASGSPEPKIIWKTPAKALIDEHFSSDQRIKVFSNGSLIIRSVTEKDHGDYLCLARNKGGDDFVLMKVSVRMKAAKIEQKDLKNHKVLYGGDLKMDCVASGLPNPEITWSLPDGTMVNSVMQPHGDGGRTRRYVVFDNGTLYFNAVGMKEEGDYTCYAENQIGKDEMKIRISVVASPPTIHNNTMEVIRVPHGENVSLTCRAKGQPSPTITWFSPNNHIISLLASDKYRLTTDGILEIHKVQRLDSGNFTCLAKNTVGLDKKVVIVSVVTSAPSINGAKLPVTRAEVTAEKDHQVLLHCKAEGTPYPHVTWVTPGNVVLPVPYYSSRIVVHPNGTLEIRNLSKSDSAQLLCLARNDAGEAQLQVQLHITERVEKPTLKGLATENIQITSGTSVILNCSMEGIPHPEITWFLPNGTTLSNGSSNFRFKHLPDGALVIREPSDSEVGVYRCVGRNSGGSAERTVTLESKQKPVIRSKYGSLVSIINGENLQLNCLSSGNPVPKLTWTLPNGEILTKPWRTGRYVVFDNGTLTVLQASVYDRGTYRCNSANEHGASSMTVAVIVIAYPPRITTGPSAVTYGRPGHAVKLDCLAIGIPKPEIVWEMPDKSQLKSGLHLRLYGNRFIHPHGSLVIQNPSSRDNGFYKCTAKNVIGSDVRETYVYVF